MKLDDLKHLPMHECPPMRALEIAVISVFSKQHIMYVSGFCEWLQDASNRLIVGSSVNNEGIIQDYSDFALPNIDSYEVIKKL